MTREQLYVLVHGRQSGIYKKWFGEEGAHAAPMAMVTFPQKGGYADKRPSARSTRGAEWRVSKNVLERPKTRMDR